jgi:hypothetical protein
MTRWAALLCVIGVVCAQAHNAKGTTKFPAAPSIAGLHIVGNQFKNGSGQVVQLRGVDFNGPDYECLDGTVGDIWDPHGGSVNAQTIPGPDVIAAMASWGINALRLAVNESCWLNINGATTGGSAYITPIVTFVNSLNAAGIVVIIDLQVAGPGTQVANQTWCGGNFAPVPDLDHAPAFWTSVANTFKTNPDVFFDLYNEPLPDNNQDTPLAWSILLNGASITSCPTTYTSVGTQALVTAIRATGATNVIEVPGIQFTTQLDSWAANEPTDPTLAGFIGTWVAQIDAAWHSYQGQVCANSSCWIGTIKPLAASVPVDAEEIGENDCGIGYVSPLMQFLDSVNANYLAWAWNTYGCSSQPSVVTNANNGTPTAFGLGIQTHYLALLGSPLPTPTVIPFFNNAVFPYGIRVGYTGGTTYNASTGTPYLPDVAASGLSIDTTTYGFTAFTTADTITGTPDPTLYATGRTGQSALWTFNVPNGLYYVTFQMAPNSVHTAGSTGQNQLINNNFVGNCVWSSNPSSSGGCGSVQTNPALDIAATIEYSVTVTGQTLVVQPEAAGTATILNAITISKTP